MKFRKMRTLSPKPSHYSYHRLQHVKICTCWITLPKSRHQMDFKKLCHWYILHLFTLRVFSARIKFLVKMMYFWNSYATYWLDDEIVILLVNATGIWRWYTLELLLINWWQICGKMCMHILAHQLWYFCVKVKIIWRSL